MGFGSLLRIRPTSKPGDTAGGAVFNNEIRGLKESTGLSLREQELREEGIYTVGVLPKTGLAVVFYQAYSPPENYSPTIAYVGRGSIEHWFKGDLEVKGDLGVGRLEACSMSALIEHARAQVLRNKGDISIDMYSLGLSSDEISEYRDLMRSMEKAPLDPDLELAFI